MGRRRERDHITAASAAYLNKGVQRTGDSTRFSTISAVTCLSPAAQLMPGVRRQWEADGRYKTEIEEATMPYSAVMSIVTLTLSLLVAPLATNAQPRREIPRVGVLEPPSIVWDSGGTLFGFTEGALDAGPAHGLSGSRALFLITPGGGKEPGLVTVGSPVGS